MHLQDAEGELKYDLDYASVNAPIVGSRQVERLTSWLGTKINIYPKLESVKDLDDSGNDWLQVASHPAICKLDMAPYSSARREAIKEGIIRALCSGGHICVAHADPRVSVFYCDTFIVYFVYLR